MAEITGKPAKPGRTRTSERLRAAARELFYSYGVQAVNVGAIATRAGVTKVTLYQHYRSKDQLLADALRERSRLWHTSLQDYVNDIDGPAERLLGVFDWYEAWFSQEGFRGCAMVNAEVEVGHSNPEVRDIVAGHKQTTREVLHRLATEATLNDPDGLAGELQLLAEGAITMALVEETANPARRARAAAYALIQARI